MPLGRLFKVECAHCKCTIVPAHEKVRNPGVVWSVCTACKIKAERRLEEAREQAKGLLV